MSLLHVWGRLNFDRIWSLEDYWIGLGGIPFPITKLLSMILFFSNFSFAPTYICSVTGMLRNKGCFRIVNKRLNLFFLFSFLVILVREGRWKSPFYQELRTLHGEPYMIRAIKVQTIRWIRHVQRITDEWMPKILLRIKKEFKGNNKIMKIYYSYT